MHTYTQILSIDDENTERKVNGERKKYGKMEEDWTMIFFFWLLSELKSIEQQHRRRKKTTDSRIAEDRCTSGLCCSSKFVFIICEKLFFSSVALFDKLLHGKNELKKAR